MKTEVKKLPKSRIELTIEVPASDMAGYFDDAYREVGQTVELPGFRKGHAPKALIRERVGLERIANTALDHALPHSYQAALAKEELVPISEPTVHVKEFGEEKPLIYVAELDVLPEVDLGKWKSVSLKKSKFPVEKVDEKEIDEALLRLRKSAATPKPVDRPAQNGDWVEISYTGTVDGVSQESLASQRQPLVLGEGAVIADFEKELVGMKPKETKVFTAKVPRRDADSQEVEFTVTVLAVSELEMPSLDDKFAQRFGKKNASELREAIVQEYQADREREARQNLEQAALDAVAAKAKVDLPESLIEREIARRIELLTEQLRMTNQTLSQWLTKQKKDEESFRKELRPAAEQSVKIGLVLRAIADTEGLAKAGENVGEEELKKTVGYITDLVSA